MQFIRIDGIIITFDIEVDNGLIFFKLRLHGVQSLPVLILSDQTVLFSIRFLCFQT